MEIRSNEKSILSATETSLPALGSLGHIGLLAGLLSMAMLLTPHRMIGVATLCLVVCMWVYPASLRRLFRLRWLFLCAGLFLLNIVWAGVEPGASPGWVSGLQMVARALIILVAVDGFTSRVEITELAGLVERLGFRGLGFSLGVAINLLPSLRQASTNAWHSLRMRGGLRHQRWRGLQLFLTTVMANAIRRAEEIALAAETRAYAPEHSPPLPLKIGMLDGWVCLAALGSAAVLLLWR